MYVSVHRDIMLPERVAVTSQQRTFDSWDEIIEITAIAIEVEEGEGGEGNACKRSEFLACLVWVRILG